MKYLILTLFLLTSIFSYGCTQSETDEIKTFILVRHAEKFDDSRDPDLAEDGIARSYLLDYMLEKVNPDSIYTSPYIRTRETIRYVAERNQLEPVVYDPQDQEELVKRWLEADGEFTFVISGHSNSIPELANLLLNRTHFAEKFDESDYGNILIITVSDSDANILHLRY
tara:strand:- start:1050 stop:1556 length:507 start_codon:yes stop_codon:yes gene_type:complete